VCVRYCQIKTTSRVERKDLLEIQTAGLSPQDQGSATWVNWVVGFIGGAEPWGRERESLVFDYL
jgi:hypothetical protein